MFSVLCAKQGEHRSKILRLILLQEFVVILPSKSDSVRKSRFGPPFKKIVNLTLMTMN